MSAKYANLPDIDTAQDIYETEDVFPSSRTQGDSSDDETVPTRSAMRSKSGETAFNSQELDVGHLMNAEEASKKFRKAEKRRARPRSHYMYPPSSTHSDSESIDGESSRPVPLSRRLKSLQAELASLESELADPSNPSLQEPTIDSGDLLRGLVDARGRLEKIKRGTEGRGKLVNVLLGQKSANGLPSSREELANAKEVNDKPMSGDVRNLVEMDKRVAELEKFVGTSTAAIDETSPLPLPLVTQISRIHYQLHALTTPRHIDNISRRLKLLMSDLDRASNAQQTHRRHPSQSNGNLSDSNANIKLPSDIIPILHRLNPALPQIPHILTRLRTLSALHASAGDFQATLESLEDEQLRVKESLDELETDIRTVESSLEENRSIVNGNVEGLEKRVNDLFKRLDNLGT